MNLVSIIKEEVAKSKIWYHGTPDVRDVKQTGSFEARTNTTDYITDPPKWNELQDQMQQARKAGDEDLYFNLLKQAGDLRKRMSYKRPIYFTNNHGVANTYAEMFRILVENGIVKKSQLDALEKMATFRNIIVHDYEKIDPTIVVGILQKNLHDFEAFKNSVIAYLNPKP